MVLKHGLGPPFFRILPACFITRTSICLVPIVVFQVICGRLLRLATPPCGPSPVTVPCRGMPCASASDWPASVVLIIRPGSTPITVDLRIGESSRKGQGSTSKRTSQPLTGLFPERQGVKRHRSSHVRKGVASQPYGRRSRKVEIKDRQELAHEINRAIRSRPGETSCQICGISETSQGRTNPLTHARMCQEATRTLQQGSPPLLIFADANLSERYVSGHSPVGSSTKKVVNILVVSESWEHQSAYGSHGAQPFASSRPTSNRPASPLSSCRSQRLP